MYATMQHIYVYMQYNDVIIRDKYVKICNLGLLHVNIITWGIDKNNPHVRIRLVRLHVDMKGMEVCQHSIIIRYMSILYFHVK